MAQGSHRSSRLVLVDMDRTGNSIRWRFDWRTAEGSVPLVARSTQNQTAVLVDLQTLGAANVELPPTLIDAITVRIREELARMCAYRKFGHQLPESYPQRDRRYAYAYAILSRAAA